MNAILGHDDAVAALLAAAQGSRMHHGWILAGPQGIGKGSLAQAFALRLLAQAAEPGLPPGLPVPEDHPIAKLVAAGTHPDFVTLARLVKDDKGEGEARLARNISVDQVRGLQRLLNIRPSLSNRRVVVIDAADDMERGAANALLKSLEEPPADLVFLLVSHAPGRLLPTIRSRCRMLTLQPLDEQAMRVVLARALPEAEPLEIDAMVRAGAGSPGRALGFAGLGLDEIEQRLTSIAATGDPDNSQRLALSRALALKAARPRYEAFLQRAPAFIAAAARTRTGNGLADAIAAWETASGLAGSAPILSLDPAATVFTLCNHVATLAEMRKAA